MLIGFVHGLRHLRADIRKYLPAFLAMAAATTLLLATTLSTGIAAERMSTGVESLGGIADVGLVPEAAGGLIAEEQVEEIARMSDVALAIPTYSESTVLRGPDGRELTPMLTGYPARHNAGLAFEGLEGDLPGRGAAELLLPRDVAEELGAGVGDPVEALGSGGVERLRTVGIVEPDELGMMAYENVFTDLGTAQRLFHHESQVTRVDVQVRSDPGQWALMAQQRLPEGVVVQETGAITASFAPVLQAVGIVLKVVSGAALAMTVLLTVVAFSSVVRARRRSYSLLRTIGAPRGWVVRGVLTEATILGVLAGLVGALIGPVLTLGLLRVLPGEGGWPSFSGVLLHALLSWAICVVAALAGCAAALGQLYARGALHGLTLAERGISRRCRALLGGGGLAAIAAAALLLRPEGTTLSFAVAFFLLLTGGALTGPLLVAGSARLLARGRWTLAYAARRLSAEGQMTAPVVIIVIMVGLSASLLVVAGSLGGAMERQIASQFGADVQVSSQVPVHEEDPGGLRDVEEVRRVTAVGTLDLEVRSERTEGSGIRTSALSIDPAGFFDTAQLAFTETGSEDDVRRALDAGAVALPESVAGALGVGPGDSVFLRVEERSVRAPVAGVFVSLSTGTQLVVPRVVTEQLGDAPGYDAWHLAVAECSSAGDVRDRVEAAVRDALPGASVITGAEMRDRAAGEIATYTFSVLGLVCITVLVGSAGIAGILSLSVLRRSVELSTLRAIGLSAGAVGRLLLAEALILALPAILSGVLAGTAAGWALCRVLADAMGVSAVFHVDLALTCVLAGLTLGALTITGCWPAIRARRTAPAASLKSA